MAYVRRMKIAVKKKCSRLIWTSIQLGLELTHNLDVYSKLEDEIGITPCATSIKAHVSAIRSNIYASAYWNQRAHVYTHEIRTAITNKTSNKDSLLPK